MEGLVSLVRFLASQLRFRSARALTLGAGILVAAVSFTILTSAATTSRLQVQSTVARNFRGAYDILVRPPGSFAPVERDAGLVRANYLAGIFGGISLRQYEDVKRIPDVEVAAPIANLGYVAPIQKLPVTIDEVLTRDPVQLYRLRYDWLANNRLSRFQGGSVYVYYTRRHKLQAVDGFPAEVLPGGRRVQVCNPEHSTSRGSYLACFSERSPKVPAIAGFPAGRVGGQADLQTPILLAAIDPEQEARLLGLDRAMVAGRYLRGSDDDAVAPPGGMRLRTVPILASSRLYLDQVLETSVERLAVPPGVDVAARLSSPGAARFLARLRGRVVQRQQHSPAPIYEQALRRYSGPAADVGSLLAGYWSVSPVAYRTLGSNRLAPLQTENPDEVWRLIFNGMAKPPGSDDVQYRKVHPHAGSPDVDPAGVVYASAMRIVGRFDPERLPGFSPLSQVPLETYYPPGVEPADAAGQRALGGQPLRPTSNIGGYLAQPPLLLTTLTALDALTDPKAYRAANHAAPVSVIRIRVAGVTGPDKVSRERIRRVAAAIVARTGLAVDVTAGSSPHPLLVELPAGRGGQPPLLVKEGWVKKGAAITILAALDHKSVALFFLVLLTCTCFVANGAFAAVRARRAEIGTLRCLGWPASRVFGVILGELAAVGLAAGLLGAVLATALVHLLHLQMALGQIVLVVPVAVWLAVAAGVPPAWRAARIDPLDAVRPPAVGARTARPVRSVGAMALANLGRMPGRTLLGVAGLAVGVAAFTTLLAINLAFRGSVSGTLLGNLLAVQVRGVDFASALLAIGLGGLSVADVLFLNFRERQAELVTLATTGWGGRELARLGMLEGAGMGVLGSLGGTALGLGAAAFLGQTAIAGLALAGAIAGLVGVAVVAALSLVPLRALRTLSAPTVLAEE